MSEFAVHSIPGSPFGRAVLATLEEKGASYRLSPVAPGTFRSAEHLARHPFGRRGIAYGFALGIAQLGELDSEDLS